MAIPFSITRRLQFRDTDCAGIAHFTSFYGYMEEAEHEMLRSIGLHVFTEDDSGMISWPRVSSHCDFRAPIRFDEQFTVAAWVAEITEKSVKYGFQFTRGETVLAEGYTIAACCRVDEGQRPRAVPIPTNMVESLQKLQA